MTEPVASDRQGAGVAQRRSRLWLWGGVVLALAVLATILFRPVSGGTADEARTLVVGDQRGGAQALLKAAGELDDVPYQIKWALFPAASPLLEALDAGAIDIGGIGAAPFAFAYASGAQIRAVTAYRPTGDHAGRASAIVVPKNSPIQTLADLRGGTPEENAEALRAVLSGAAGPYRDIVLLNAAAALVVADAVPDLKTGVAKAADCIASGQATLALDRLVSITNTPLTL